MKKILFILLTISIILYSGFEQTTVYGFQGMNTEMENADGVVVNAEELSLDEQVDLVDGKCLGDMAIIGHSLGGVRALGLASKLSNEPAELDRLKAVITVGSPVRGYSPLLVGKSGLVSRINKVENDLANGVSAIFALPPFTGSIALSLPGVRNAVHEAIFTDEGLKSIINGSIADAPGIADLNPYSSYYAQNIGIVEYKLCRAPATPQGGQQLMLEYRGGYKLISIKTVGQVYVAEYIRPGTHKISTAIPIGNVIGTENNPMTALPDSKRADVQDTLDTLENIFYTGSLVYTSTAVGTAVASFWNPIFLIPTLTSYVNAEKCDKAKDIVASPTNTLGRLLGSTANDCFILEKDQSLTLGANGYGGTPIDSERNINKYRVKSNHLDEPKHKDIWGGEENGEHGMEGDQMTWTSDSIIGQWLELQNIDESSGEIIR